MSLNTLQYTMLRRQLTDMGLSLGTAMRRGVDLSMLQRLLNQRELYNKHSPEYGNCTKHLELTVNGPMVLRRID